MAFRPDFVLQVANGFASEDLSAGLSSVVTVATGFAVVDLESFLRCNCHNRLLILF